MRKKNVMMEKIHLAVTMALIIAWALYVGGMDAQDEMAKEDPTVYWR